jgi:hypothetical protein
MLMYFQIFQELECLITHITAIWTIPCMNTKMYLQTTFVTECYITHITARGTLPNMYTFMYIQVFQFSECFITHITPIRTIPSMYTLMFLQISKLLKCFLHTPQGYVCSTVCITWCCFKVPCSLSVPLEVPCLKDKWKYYYYFKDR